MFNYINFILLAILLLIFSCDEKLKPVLEGCTIKTDCNYDAIATDKCNGDNSCCVAPQGCNKWCVGDTTQILVFDCADQCGGDRVEDNCGTCDNDSSNDCVQDCAGEWGGPDNTPDSGDEASYDECGFCGGVGIPYGQCDCDGHVRDCTGECGGSTPVDECGVCDGPGEIEGCSCEDIPEGDCDCNGNVADCKGACGGSAVEDACGVCDADASNDNTPLTGNCDCNGSPNGDAFIDGCDNCVGGNTGLTACETDCLGTLNGDAVYDNCGTCDANSSNDCVQDCAGVWGGFAELDECGVCDGDGPEEYQDCDGNCLASLDCADQCGGSLVIDDCGVCAGNNDCFGCNDWKMGNFICDDAIDAAEKCCVEDDNNNENRCRMLYDSGNGCSDISVCQKESIMECDICNPGGTDIGWVPDPACSSYCDYDGAAVGDPCSISEGSFTEGEGLCIKACDIRESNCSNIACNDPQLNEYCDYDGAEVGTPCSTSQGSFTEGEGLCALNLDDDKDFPTGYITYDAGCADGTDGCCDEPTCDEPVTLSLEYIVASSTLEVNYSSTEVISGFQFTVNGATVYSASGGAAEDAEFMISTANNKIIAFSFSGTTLPVTDSVTLTNLDVDTGVSTQLCLQDVIISDPSANLINTCPNYWWLTCISIP